MNPTFNKRVKELQNQKNTTQELEKENETLKLAIDEMLLERTDLQLQLVFKDAKIDMIKEILKEIEIGAGTFSKDRLTHAMNCIENMRTLAMRAIERIEKPFNK